MSKYVSNDVVFWKIFDKNLLDYTAARLGLLCWWESLLEFPLAGGAEQQSGQTVYCHYWLCTLHYTVYYTLHRPSASILCPPVSCLLPAIHNTYIQHSYTFILSSNILFSPPHRNTEWYAIPVWCRDLINIIEDVDRRELSIHTPSGFIFPVHYCNFCSYSVAMLAGLCLCIVKLSIQTYI